MISTTLDIAFYNAQLRGASPEEIIAWAYTKAHSPIATTSFGVYSAALLYACTNVAKNIPVIWCDTGYNTKATYSHANKLIKSLSLTIDIFTPKRTTAHLDSLLGRPNINNPNHKMFAEEVKLEPFARALDKYKPDVWFSNLRFGKTSFRNTLDILSFTEDGILKVSPFYHFSDEDLIQYLKQHNLPMELDYYDPVKALEHRECGIHFS